MIEAILKLLKWAFCSSLTYIQFSVQVLMDGVLFLGVIGTANLFPLEQLFLHDVLWFGSRRFVMCTI